MINDNVQQKSIIVSGMDDPQPEAIEREKAELLPARPLRPPRPATLFRSEAGDRSIPQRDPRSVAR